MIDKIIAVDFDGTVVDDKYPEIGKAKIFAFETLRQLQSDGYRLTLWTYRSGRALDEAVEFCKKNGIEFYAINNSFEGEDFDKTKQSRKINADIFIDDRNLGGFPGWSAVYQIIKNRIELNIQDHGQEAPKSEKEKRIFRIMIHLKSKEELELMYLSAQLVSKTLGVLAKEVKPGVTTNHLDKLGGEYIRDNGGYPAFLGMYDFPKNLCISPNTEVVHGIPNDKPLKDGDIVSVDCGVYMNDFYGDHAYTFAVGEVSEETEKLLRITKESLYKGIEQMKKGNRIGDIGFAIQQHCEKEGYGIVRELVGHGLGRKMHEDPQVPNYGRRGSGKKIEDGMVLAIEPMVNMGTEKVFFHPDGWTVTTLDDKYSAHYEHDVCVVDGQPKLLSTFQYIYDALGIVSDEEKPFLFKP